MSPLAQRTAPASRSTTRTTGSGQPVVLIHGHPLDGHSWASPYATYACVDTWLTDFRDDLPKIDVPTLVVHGTEDRILPYEATAARLLGLIKDLTLVTVEGGPHNIGWTHPDEVNAALLHSWSADPPDPPRESDRFPECSMPPTPATAHNGLRGQPYNLVRPGCLL